MLFPDDVYNEEAGEIGLAFCVLCAIPQGSPDKVQEREMLKQITLVVDEEWLKAIQNLTQDVYEGEMCRWLSVEDYKQHADFPTAI